MKAKVINVLWKLLLVVSVLQMIWGLVVIAIGVYIAVGKLFAGAYLIGEGVVRFAIGLGLAWIYEWWDRRKTKQQVKLEAK